MEDEVVSIEGRVVFWILWSLIGVHVYFVFPLDVVDFSVKIRGSD